MAWTRGKIIEEERTTLRQKVGGLSHLPLVTFGLMLSLCGILSIYSSSAVLGLQNYGDSLYYVKKQAAFLSLGWLVYFSIAQINIHRVFRHRFIILGLCLAMLLVVLVPGLGTIGGGARRWINLGVVGFQPSEFVRLFLVLYLAATLYFRSDRLRSFNRGFVPLLMVSSVLMFLLILQPDFGSAMNIFLLSLCMWFIGGVPMAYLAGIFVLALPAVAMLVYKAAYRSQRVLSFLDPWSDPQGSGFQVIQSYLAFHTGGWFGVGVGQGQQKLFYLPKAHTDFIYSVIGEELGVVGALFVISLFVGLLYSGAQITRKQESKVGYLTAAGLTVFLGVPALFNLMVTVGLLPTKGLPLPFFSSGGSSLIASLAALGILQSLHFHYQQGDPKE